MTKRIFNHNIRPFLADTRKVLARSKVPNSLALAILGDEVGYPSQALVLSRQEDVVQLPACLAREWDEIARHYHQAGLDFSRQVVWTLDYKVTRNSQLEPSVVCSKPDIIGQAADNLEAVTGRKSDSARLLDLSGMTRPYTVVCRSRSDLPNPATLPFPCYLKLDNDSRFGLGVRHCRDSSELLAGIASIRGDHGFLVQADSCRHLPANGHPPAVYQLTGKLDPVRGSVQYGGVVKVVSHRRLEPAEYDVAQSIYEQTAKLVRYLLLRGRAGKFNLKVAAVKREKGYTLEVIDLNAGYTRADYYLSAAERIGARHWTAVTLDTNQRRLAEISLPDLEYRPGLNSEGVLVVNWGSIHQGGLGVLITAASADRVASLENELKSRL